MKEVVLKKLIISIETTNHKNIPSEVMDIIYDLEKSTTSNEAVKVSFAMDENDKTECMKNNHPDYISPANWNYWPV